MKQLAAMSKEILERICVDEQFAGFIKSMVVVAMSASVMKSLYGASSRDQVRSQATSEG